MASGKSNLSSLYQQRKKPSNGKEKRAIGRQSSNKFADKVHATLEEASSAASSLGSGHSQPAALVSAGGQSDMDAEYNEQEDMLRQFDMDMRFGPCLGMTRLERWERAERLGMNPPQEVKKILGQAGGSPACLWEGRV